MAADDRADGMDADILRAEFFPHQVRYIFRVRMAVPVADEHRLGGRVHCVLFHMRHQRVQAGLAAAPDTRPPRLR